MVYLTSTSWPANVNWQLVYLLLAGVFNLVMLLTVTEYYLFAQPHYAFVLQTLTEATSRSHVYLFIIYFSLS